jgi:hypothetical protein
LMFPLLWFALLIRSITYQVYSPGKKCIFEL